VNQAKYRLLLARTWHDIAAVQSAALVVEGDRNGWYRALRSPLTPDEFARASGLAPRAARMWLTNQHAAGYVTFADERYSLDEEQAAVFTADDSVPAGFALAASLTCGDPAGAAQTIPAAQDRQDFPSLAIDAVDRMSAANARSLAPRWIPEDLRDSTILDVGCGRGGVSRELARQFPNARIHGIDLRAQPEPSERVTFARCDAVAVTGRYDLALMVDVLHELADPELVLKHLHEQARALVVVEPMLEEGVSARLMSAAAFLYCLPTSGHADFRDEQTLRAMLKNAGFTSVQRRDDPSHLVLEAR
jgi:2-polyprenyl-3-methyl-5-hydroxy-6-metoxy-1,4-benzoquinol methylase